jgi:aquaporin Z
MPTSIQSVTPRRLLSEFLGTFLLTFAVFASIAKGSAVPTPITAAFTLMVLVYLLGPISGCHINPAISLGLFGLRRMTATELAGYIVAQLLGAVAAVLLLLQIAELPAPPILALTPSVIGELLGMFAFSFGVAMVVMKRVDVAASGLVVGLSLLLGIAVAAAGSQAIINPAVAVALAVAHPDMEAGLLTHALIYVIVTLAGGFLGMQAARWFATEK